jgi:hypothetical protein
VPSNKLQGTGILCNFIEKVYLKSHIINLEYKVERNRNFNGLPYERQQTIVVPYFRYKIDKC